MGDYRGNDLIFKDNFGYPLHFIIIPAATDAAIVEQQSVKEFIENRAGTVSFNLNDFGPHSAVLIDDNAKTWAHNKDVFKLSYIHACMKENRVVDLSQFLHSRVSDLVSDFPYMDIFYYKKLNWFNIPAQYKLSTNSNSDERMQLAAFKCSHCNVEVNSQNKSTDIEQLRTVETKRTRKKYSTQENEAILRYIVENNLYEHVKGVAMWKEMEAANICPLRTWQSLKEHSLTVLPKILHKYIFFTANDIHLLHINNKTHTI